MKKSLLATVAAVALIAGTGMVSAAEGAKDQPAATAGHAEMQKAPDAKAGAQIKGKAETNGSGAADIKAEPKAKPSTTGAGPAENNKADMKAGAKVRSR